MKLGTIARIVCCLCLFLFWGLGATFSFAGPLRITMTDDTTLEVPYFWEERGEIKFEIPGGIAGLPKSQVKSVQEVITSREFDPVVLLESPKAANNIDQRKMLEDLIASKTASTSNRELSADEGLQWLRSGEGSTGEPLPSKERVHGPTFNLEGDFSQLVRPNGQGVVLVMRNVLSSRSDLSNEKFVLTLYDSNGEVLQQRPCELQELDVDNKTLKGLGIRGRLYSVMATVKPDPKIKRYDITAVQR